MSLMGTCAGCSAGIPWGYIPLIAPPTERASEIPRLNAAFKLSVQRLDLYCRKCPDSQEVLTEQRKHYRRRRALPEETIEETPALTAKDIAIKLLKVIDDEPASSKKLMRRAEIDEDYAEVALSVLRKLADADKIKKVKSEEGGVKWAAL